MQRLTSAALVLLSFFVLHAPAFAATKSLASKFAGSSTATTDADFNGDMQGSGEGQSFGTGKLGTFVAHSQADREPWDGSTYCDFDETGAPIAIQEEYIGFVSVVSYQNGEDQWFDELDTSQPSTLCFNFVDGTFTFEVHTIITGGSGQFEGATGFATTSGSGSVLRSGFSQSTGTTTGEITYDKVK